MRKCLLVLVAALTAGFAPAPFPKPAKPGQEMDLKKALSRLKPFDVRSRGMQSGGKSRGSDLLIWTLRDHQIRTFQKKR